MKVDKMGNIRFIRDLTLEKEERKHGTTKEEADLIPKPPIFTVKNISHFLRNYTTGGPAVSLAVDDKTGIATITMQQNPVNVLTTELLNEQGNTFQELEKNKSRGAMLTSGLNTVFSAGLDLTQVYKPEPDRLKQFLSTLQQAWRNLYSSSYPTVAVINGHAPAGGCMLALACEYRIMMNNFTIGLNESRLGFKASNGLMAASMRYAIGTRQTEMALTTRRLFKTDEAFKIGLVDEVVQSQEEGIERAYKFLKRFAKIPPLARARTKQFLRDEIQDVVDTSQSTVDQSLAYFNSPEVSEAVGLYWNSLKKKQNDFM